MRETYASHTGQQDGKRVVTKWMIDHTAGVRNKALDRLSSLVNFHLEWPLSLREFLSEVTSLHDIGKLTKFFQDYLRDLPVDPRSLKRHTFFGAAVAWRRWNDTNPELAHLAAYLIAYHHASLRQPGEDNSALHKDKAETHELLSEAHEQLATLPDVAEVNRILGMTDLAPGIPEFKSIRRLLAQTAEVWCERYVDYPGLSTYLATNYCFSLLIEADKLDASETQPYPILPMAYGHLVNEFVQGLDDSRLPEKRRALNRRRNRARQEIVAHLEREDILDRRMFVLTAPTGLGKTFSGLDFALGLCQRLDAIRPGDQRTQIIVALPFISIIEQTLQVYEEVFAGTDIRFAGHYQFADVLSQYDPDAESSDREGDRAKAYGHAKMQLETWQADVIVTSFVQLFQSMVTGRNAALKKFNHLAGAIILLDEIQGLPSEYAPFVGALLHCMTVHLNMRVIMMTATQPRILEQASTVLRNNKVPTTLAPFQLLPNHERYFAEFNRTRIVSEINLAIPDTEHFTDYFGERWNGMDCALVVVNKVNRSLKVFDMLQARYAEDAELFYLSTNLLPAHRGTALQQIGAALRRRDERPVILVSTQVVEAGVDLDFDVGFRDIAPISSLVQVAGRINRNDREGREASTLYVFRLGEGGKSDGTTVYGSIDIDATAHTLSQYGGPILEKHYGDLVATYFKRLDKGVYNTSNKLFQACETLNYEHLKTFKLISEQNYVREVLIECEAAMEAVAAFEQLKLSSGPDSFARKANFEADHGRTFREHILNVPTYCIKDEDPVEELTDRLSIVRQDDVDQMYRLPTGWVRNRDTAAKNKAVGVYL